MRTTIGLSLALALVPAVASAKQGHAAHHHPTPSVKARHVQAGGDVGRIRANRRRPALAQAAPRRRSHDVAHHAIARREHHAAGHVIAGRAVRHWHHQRDFGRLAPEDRYVGPLRAIGPREVGKAAWYGPRFLGGRTASGERLDSIHATAAHRWLPLHSLVRITNLENGRTTVAEINDRGPVSHSLLIDLSPRTARELDMIHRGVAPVVVVPVVAIRKTAAVAFPAHRHSGVARRNAQPRR